MGIYIVSTRSSWSIRQGGINPTLFYISIITIILYSYDPYDGLFDIRFSEPDDSRRLRSGFGFE